MQHACMDKIILFPKAFLKGSRETFPKQFLKDVRETFLIKLHAYADLFLLKCDSTPRFEVRFSLKP